MTQDLATGIKWYLAFLFSTTVHEAAHAGTALKLGDDTAQRGGQVTLDPTPHLRRAPVGLVVAPIVSYILGGPTIVSRQSLLLTRTNYETEPVGTVFAGLADDHLPGAGG